MKPFATRLFGNAAGTFAAVLIASAAIVPVHAQELRVRGNIPFTFAADRAVLAAGNYQISPVSRAANPTSVVLYNRDQKNSTMVGVIDRIQSPKDPTPRIEFQCADQACQLVRIYDGVYGWDVAAPKKHSVEKERLLAIKVSVARSK